VLSPRLSQRSGYRDGRSAALLAEQAALQPGALSRQQLCNVLWALGALQSAEVSLAKSLGRELEQRLMGEDEHGARLDYSQVFHAGMMMNMQWKVAAAPLHANKPYSSSHQPSLEMQQRTVFFCPSIFTFFCN
jgi:choline dehydrogenase-like flavoprotein